MGLYARRPARFAAQLTVDVLVLAWGVFWALAGRFIDATIGSVATPLRRASSSASDLSGQFRSAGSEMSRVPGVGDNLRKPFDNAAESLTQIMTSLNDQIISVERIADLVGWLVFLIPVSIVVAFWLPRRIRFYRLSRAAQRFIDAQADLDLFALRALANQPMHVLAGISDDPVADWRRGDPAVVHRLADAELRRAGLRLPARMHED
ncbi:hypothetical protein GCM10009841_18350 [Microlunatus panaciterrae]|uniref:Uncharacterized protein n=1 Tax=Microlunatus panaciterrae TaxID=400768 RepID=A0ABS2RNT7_9ACTN|nr:hypothetical protein [Microlunatus panaciterrae]MBM7800393.1 hypothetical protein [Microlunatus panaciterrae]